MINDMKWGRFKVPVKVEQLNAHIFSDTTKINKKKWKENESIADIRPSGRGGRATVSDYKKESKEMHIL